MKVWQDKEDKLNFEAVVKRANQPDRSGFLYTREALEGAVKTFLETRKPPFGGIYDAWKCDDFEFLPEVAFEVCKMQLDKDSSLVISGRVLDTPMGARLAECFKAHAALSADSRLTVGAAGFGQVFTASGQPVVESFTVTRVTVLPESQSTTGETMKPGRPIHSALEVTRKHPKTPDPRREKPRRGPSS